MSVSELKSKILACSKEDQCRLFLNGRELHDHHFLGNYSLRDGMVEICYKLDNPSLYVIE